MIGVTIINYKIVSCADLHWGIMDAKKQNEENQNIIKYLRDNTIDLFVMCGDYFDHRLLLNSPATIFAQNFICDIKLIAKDNGMKIRFISGTESHDNGQMESLRIFEDETFKIFTTCTLEETLPGFKCLYCPEENMSNDDYYKTYASTLFTGEKYDVMFFHGTFDAIMGKFTMNTSGAINTIIFELAVFNKLCTVMIGGHWHDGGSIGNMHYTRSNSRWKYEEDNPKGFILMDYDCDNDSYKIKRIENTNTDNYITFTIDTSVYCSRDNYANLMRNVEEVLSKNSRNHIRIMILLTDEKQLNDICIDTIKTRFANTRNVKININNLLKKTKNEARHNELQDLSNKFSFLFVKGASIPEIYQKFIKLTNGADIDINILEELLGDSIKKYNEKIKVKNESPE